MASLLAVSTLTPLARFAHILHLDLNSIQDADSQAFKDFRSIVGEDEISTT